MLVDNYKMDYGLVNWVGNQIYHLMYHILLIQYLMVYMVM